MKKQFALGLISILSAMSFAQSSAEPIVIPDATARKISIDGKWVACYGMSIVVYNVESQESEIYPECSLGKGNCVALDGTVVGSRDDFSILMKGGEIIDATILDEYELSGINGINSEGSIITGYIKNPVLTGDDSVDPFDEGITVFIPFYSELNADGSIEKINILPYPEQDFLGYAPMYVTGEWISEDGKTILGTMTDSYGRFADPIVYIQDANGEWSYITPTKEFFNPDGIELPENPWDKFPNEPAVKDYMNTWQYQAYLKALEDSLFNGGPEVNPIEYMSEEMAQKYIKDYDEYENYFNNHLDEINAYENAYRKILETSVYFGDTAMDPQGEYFASVGMNYDEEGKGLPSNVMIFNTHTGEYKEIESQYSGLKIHQILSDGTILAYTGLFTYDILKGYILLPGATDFIPFSEYISATNPGYGNWLEEIFPKGEGIISASDDLTVIAGGLDILSAASEDLFPNSIILSYVLPNVKYSGVETIEMSSADGTYNVYNLMGVKVLETKDKSELLNLRKGIYIINGKKIAL